MRTLRPVKFAAVELLDKHLTFVHTESENSGGGASTISCCDGDSSLLFLLHAVAPTRRVVRSVLREFCGRAKKEKLIEN